MASVIRSKRERNLQARAVKYARQQNWLAFKMSSPAQKGWPDYLFVKRRQYLWVEFKMEGQYPTELQVVRLTCLQQGGERAMWTDNFEVFKWALDKIDDEIARKIP